MRRRRAGRMPLLTALLGIGLLAGLSAPLVGSAAAAAATSDSRATGAATYTVDPNDHAVHVLVDMTVQDVKPDTTATIYYLTGYRFGVQPEATHVRVTHGTAVLASKQTSYAGYIELDVTFAGRLFRGHTQAFRLEYDLPDGGPRSTGLVRVAPGVAAFYAWSYGADRASVRVVVPGDCTATTQGDPMRSSTQGGLVVLTADAIKDRATWQADVSATCADQLTDHAASIPLGSARALIEVHGFPDDPSWSATVTDRLTRGLPALTELVGLPWPVAGTLDVTEAYTPSLGGYAGFYEPPQAGGGLARIQISEDPAPLVIEHEASHAWFNDSLFQERWINEGLANTYASLVLAQMGDPPAAPDTVLRGQQGSFALEDWPEPGRITDKPTQEVEAYGYDASWTVVRQFIGDVGPDRMRLVLQDAAAHQIAYAGRSAPETMSLPAGGVGWHEFLDLLEQVGGATDADRVFELWVLPGSDTALMAQHAAATAAYAQLLATGQGWLPGYGVRLPLAGWDFALATTRLAQAEAVLDLRAKLQTQAAALGIALPAPLQASYEGASGDLTATDELAAEELSTVQALSDAHAAVAAERDPFVTIGLLGSAPQAALDAASRDFTAGDDPGARAEATTALATISSAASLGQQRVVVGSVVLVLLVLLFALVVRRRTLAPGPAAGTLAAGVEPGAEEPPP